MIRFLQNEKRATKAIFIVVIGLAIVAMVITLVPGIFDTAAAQTGTYAKIGDESVTLPEIQRYAQRMAQQNRLPAQFASLMLPQAAEQLVMITAGRTEAHRLGLHVTDDELRRFLSTGQLGQILFPNGQFIGQDKYENWVQNNTGMTVGDFETMLKGSLLDEKLRMMITSSVTVSDAEVEREYKTQLEKVKFQYAVLSRQDLMKQIDPTDAELRAYYDQNKAKYANAIPAERKLEYVFIDPATVPGAGQVTEAELQQYYDQHKDQYKVPDRVKVRHILIMVPRGADAKTDAAAKAKAEDILKQIRGGGDFAALAKKYSQDPGSAAKGGDLGWVLKGQTVPEFEKAAFGLNPGQTSDLVKTQFGYHILQTEEKQSAHVQSLNEVKSEIEPIVKRQQEQRLAQTLATNLASQAGTEGLQKAADSHHLKVETAGYVSQMQPTLPGVPDAAQLLQQAFAMQPKSGPKVVPTSSGFAVVQVLDEKPARTPTFEEYKAQVLKDFREQRAGEMLAKKAQELADRAKADHDLAKAAKALGATLKTSELVGREAQVPELGSLAGPANVVFTLQPGQVGGPIQTATGAAVVELTEKKEPDPAEMAKNKDQIREALLREKRNENYIVFLTELKNRLEKEGRIRYNQQERNQLQSAASHIG